MLSTRPPRAALGRKSRGPPGTGSDLRLSNRAITARPVCPGPFFGAGSSRRAVPVIMGAEFVSDVLLESDLSAGL